jgi:hypothetical protein
VKGDEKETPLSGGKTGPPCVLGIYLQGPGPSSLRLNAGLTVFLYKNIVAKHKKENKTRSTFQRHFCGNPWFKNRCFFFSVMMIFVTWVVMFMT